MRERRGCAASSTIPSRHRRSARRTRALRAILLALALVALVFLEIGPRRLALAAEAFHQRLHVLGVLFLDGEDAFEHALRRRVAIADVVDDLAIAVDGDALGDEVLFDHR